MTKGPVYIIEDRTRPIIITLACVLLAVVGYKEWRRLRHEHPAG